MPTSYTDFTGEVQHRISEDTQAEAVRTIRAVLETLGECVDQGGATDIASPLPMEIGRYLLTVDHGQTYDYDTFVERVVERLNYEDLDLDAAYGTPAPVEPGEAVFRIKAVVALVVQVLPGGQYDHIEAQLAEDFHEIFEFVEAETTPWAVAE